MGQLSGNNTEIFRRFAAVPEVLTTHHPSQVYPRFLGHKSLKIWPKAKVFLRQSSDCVFYSQFLLTLPRLTGFLRKGTQALILFRDDVVEYGIWLVCRIGGLVLSYPCPPPFPPTSLCLPPPLQRSPLRAAILISEKWTRYFVSYNLEISPCSL